MMWLLLTAELCGAYRTLSKDECLQVFQTLSCGPEKEAKVQLSEKLEK